MPVAGVAAGQVSPALILPHSLSPIKTDDLSRRSFPLNSNDADLRAQCAGQVGDVPVMPYCVRSSSVKSRGRWEQRYLISSW